MTRIAVEDLAADIDAILRGAEIGEYMIVTQNGKDIAALSPVEETGGDAPSSSISEVIESRAFWETPSLDDLARQHHVQPLGCLADLQGDFWPEDETDEEVLEFLRRLREEGVGS